MLLATMPSLTSSADCAGCLELSQRVAILEQRIATLYEIREHELEIDVVLGRTLAAANTAQLADTEPFNPGEEDVDETLGAPEFSEEFGHIAAFDQEEEDRCYLPPGAKLNQPLSSTPAGRGTARPGDGFFHLPLQNRFSGLDFPPLPSPSGQKHLLSPLSKRSARRRVLKEAVRRHSNGQLLDPALVQSARTALPTSVETASAQHAESAPLQPGSTADGPPPHTSRPVRRASASSRGPSPQPATASLPGAPDEVKTLIIGDSIVRKVRAKRAVTYCKSGATVSDVRQGLPVLLNKHPLTENIVIHCGTNDILKRQSVLTRKEFLSLMQDLTNTGKSVFISGPIPVLYRGSERFSRLLSLNTWLQSTCASKKITFIDNFNLFWKRGHFYSKDGVHPSNTGSSALKDNIFYSVSTTSHP